MLGPTPSTVLRMELIGYEAFRHVVHADVVAIVGAVEKVNRKRSSREIVPSS